MLLLYVDDLFLTEKQELIKVTRRRLAAEFDMRDLEVWTREVCNRDPEEVLDDGVQGYGHTYGIKPEAIE